MQKYLALQKVVELGSFSRAADELGFTQSAISQMIASLEDEFSFRILNRSRNGVFLTPEGEEIYPVIEEMLGRYQILQDKARNIRSLDTGIIRIGSYASIAAQWLPKVLMHFHVYYPNVEVVINNGDLRTIPDWIRTGVVDFGFVSPDIARGIEMRPVCERQFLCILPQSHPLSDQNTILLEDLRNDPLILLEEGGYYEPLDAFRSLGITPHTKYKLYDDYAIMAMVEAGMGISFLSDIVLSRPVSYDITIHPTLPQIAGRIAIGYKSEAGLPVAARKFIETFIACLPELP